MCVDELHILIKKLVSLFVIINQVSQQNQNIILLFVLYEDIWERLTLFIGKETLQLLLPSKVPTTYVLQWVKKDMVCNK